MVKKSRENLALKPLEGHYFAYDSHGVLHLLDPILKTPLQPGVPPASFDDSVTMQAGFSQLELLAQESRLTVHLILAYHGSDTHFADILRTCGSVLSGASMVGVEADWLPSNTPAAAHNPLDLKIVRTDAPKPRRFQDAELDWLDLHEKISLPCEYIDDQSDALSRALYERWQAYESATANRNLLDPPARNATRVVTTAAYQMVREWSMIGQLGFWLSRLDKLGLLPSGPFEVPLILGSWHEPMIEHFKTLGIRVIPRLVEHPPEDDGATYDAYLPTYLSMLTTGQITPEQLAIMMPF